MIMEKFKLPTCSFYKSIELEQACKQDVFKPEWGYIHFEGGYAYATNGCLLVRANLEDICNLTEEDKKNLEGKNLSCDSYAELRTFDKIKIEKFRIISEEKNRTIIINFADNNIKLFQNMGNILKNFNMTTDREKVSMIGINPKNILILSKIIPFPEKGFYFYFQDENRAMVVKGNDSETDISAIIMPMCPPKYI